MRPDRPGLLRWPLWSWRNLVVTTLAALTLLFAVGQAMAHPSTTPSSSPSGDSATAVDANASNEPGPAPVGGTDDDASVPTPQPAANGLAAVSGFLTTRTNSPSAVAATDLSPYVTPELLSSLQGGGVAQLPFTRVYDAPVADVNTATTTAFTVRTDAGRLTVTVVRVAGGWLVDDVHVDDTVPLAPIPSIGPTRGNP